MPASWLEFFSHAFCLPSSPGALSLPLPNVVTTAAKIPRLPGRLQTILFRGKAHAVQISDIDAIQCAGRKQKSRRSFRAHFSAFPIFFYDGDIVDAISLP